jgi:PAS domain S-box-containing protein
MKEEGMNKTNLKPINWHLVWISIVLSEIITLLICLVLYGEIRTDLAIYGFAVPLLVAPVMIYCSHWMRRRAEIALIKSEEKFRSLIENSKDIIIMVDKNGIISYSSPSVRHYGFETSDLEGMEMWGFMHQEDIERVKDHMADALATPGKIISIERIRTKKKDGAVVYIESSLTNMLDNPAVSAVVINARDITPRVAYEHDLRRSLDEKDLLMKEIHHRIKNNLAVVQSLLSLQLSDISDEKIQSYFQDTKNRVQSMSMIHERLSRSEDLSTMNFSEFINSLVNNLFHTYNINPDKIKLKVSIPDISFDVDTIMPSALVLNELITNSFKYAFPGNRTGEVSVVLRVGEDNEIELVVKDNGIGIPDDINIHESNSLGLMLVSALISQMKARLEIVKNNGTEFRIKFKERRFIR